MDCQTPVNYQTLCRLLSAAFLWLLPQTPPALADSGAAADAPTPRGEAGGGVAGWEVVYTMPEDPNKRWFDGLWVADTGDLFAVGRGVIVHCSPDRVCGVETMPVDHHPTAVWGTSPSNVYAVGFLGLVLHYEGLRWTVENPMGPRARLRRDSLFDVGPYLPNTVVAGTHSESSLKRVDGKWLPLSKDDIRQLSHWKDPDGMGPCKSSGLEMWLKDEKRNQLWVICQDLKMYKQQSNIWMPGARLPKEWKSLVVHAFWKGDLFLSTERGLWTNEGGQWHREYPPGVIRGFSSSATTFYAVTLRSILKRSR